MYIAGNEITVTWILPPTDTPLVASDYDIRLIPSDLNGTYSDAAIIDFFAAYPDNSGCITYKFTPITTGRFKLWLSTGTGAAYDIINEKNFWVFGSAPSSLPSFKVPSPLRRQYFGGLVVLGPEVIDTPFTATMIRTDGLGNWVAAANAAIWYSHDDGKTWTDAGWPGASVRLLATDRLGNWMAGTLGGAAMYKSIDNGVTWNLTRSGANMGNVNRLRWVPMPTVIIPPFGVWFAVGNNRAYAWADTAGVTWTNGSNSALLQNARHIFMHNDRLFFGGYGPSGGIGARTFNDTDPTNFGLWMKHSAGDSPINTDPPGSLSNSQGDSSGSLIVSVGNLGTYYTTASGSAPWTTETYPGAPTVEINRLFYSEVESLWYIFDDADNGYTSPDATTGSWTLITDPNLITTGWSASSNDGDDGPRGWVMPIGANGIMRNTP